MKTLRLIFPEWQGGLNPNYTFGAEILSFIAPEGKNTETARVAVDTNFDKPLVKENGYYAGKTIAEQQQKAKEILAAKQPDKIITFGGDCSVSQAPFDYLHGLYPENLGIVWIDAHPDISTPTDVPNEHAMVLGNLLGDGASDLSKTVEHPFAYKDVMYAGLIADELLPYEASYIDEKKLAFTKPAELTDTSHKILSWIQENHFEKLLVHFDVDVLSSDDFRSVLYNEPGIEPVDYATGSMTLAQVFRVLGDMESVAEIVGLTFAEYMPWDLIRLRSAMEKLEIFK